MGDPHAIKEWKVGTEAVLVKWIAWEQQLLLPHYIVSPKSTEREEFGFMEIKTGSSTRNKALY